MSTYTLGLGSLILLPVGKLGLDLLDQLGNVLLAHGRVKRQERAVLNNGRGAVESLLGTTGLALLALLALGLGREVLVLAVLLADELGALKTRLVNGSLGLSGQARVGKQGRLLSLERGIEEGEQAVGTADLVQVGGLTGLGEDTLGIGLLALLDVALTLQALALPLLLAGLALVGLVSLLLAVVVILELADGGKLLLLLGLQLGALVAEAGQVLVGLVLLGLDDVELGLDLVVLLGQGLLLGVLHGVLDLLDLGAEVVDLLLGLVELAKVLAQLAQVGDVGQGLLLVDELHGARVDLLVEGLNLAVDILDALEGDLCLGRLLLVDTAAELLVQALDLVQLGRAGILATGLLLADLVGLGNELLAALLGGAGLVLVLVRERNVDLGLDGVLMMVVSTGLSAFQAVFRCFICLSSTL
jgi:hypothetical protein